MKVNAIILRWRLFDHVSDASPSTSSRSEMNSDCNELIELIAFVSRCSWVFTWYLPRIFFWNRSLPILLENDARFVVQVCLCLGNRTSRMIIHDGKVFTSCWEGNQTANEIWLHLVIQYVYHILIHLFMFLFLRTPLVLLQKFYLIKFIYLFREYLGLLKK